MLYHYEYSTNRMIEEDLTDHNIEFFTFHPGIKEKIYYTDRSKEIWLHLRGVNAPDSDVYTHQNYVASLRFGPGDRLYFSEAYGGGGNGKIYVFEGNVPRVYYEVSLHDLGYWSGEFAFDDSGTLYLANGNIGSSGLYQVTGNGVVNLVIFDFPTTGLRYVGNVILKVGQKSVNVARGLMFSDMGSNVYLYDLDEGALYKVFTDVSMRILDVSPPP